MSDNTTDDVQGEAVAAANAVPGMLVADGDGLLAAVEDRVRERTEAGDVLEDAVEKLVGQRMSRRSQILANALDKVKRLNKEEKKIGPEAKGYTRDGKPVDGETYSKCQVSRLKQIADERKAIVEAIAVQDYDKLSKLGF